jgi:hypothetical protein
MVESSSLECCIFSSLFLTAFGVTSVIHALTAEGTKIKAMIDRHIEKRIATLKEKANHEKESLTKMLSVCKQQLENAKAVKKREEKKVRNNLLHIGHFMAVVLTSDTSHANRNLTFVTTKMKIFLVFFTSQFYFLDDIFTT